MKGISLGIWVPSYSLTGILGSKAIMMASHSPRLEHLHYAESSNSLLACGFNQAWCWALNGYQAGQLTHFLLMHADVRPRADDWLDIMLDEMEKAEADLLSAIIPIKNTSGYTSTGLDTDLWNPQRLTQEQVNKELPVTWTCDNLLFNTGLMLVDLSKPWTQRVHFSINDDIIQMEDGTFRVLVEPEDWYFSRQARRHGARCFVTRAVAVDHFGSSMWSSDMVWGELSDVECPVRSGEVLVTAADGEMTRFNPSTADLPEGQLPMGWFDGDDIAFYRHIYREMVPVGGQTVEVGSYRGRSIASVADIIREKRIRVECVDLFEPYGADMATDRFEQFKRTIQDFGIADLVTIVKDDSVQFAGLFPDHTFDFVFIDADHRYEAVKADIKAWAPKVKPGHYLGGHDYRLEVGVTQAVNEAFKFIEGRPASSIWLSKV